MPNHHLSYKDARYFSDLMCDYVAQKQELNEFYHRFPSIENFEAQAKEKSTSFSSKQRERLVNQLKKQYKNIDVSDETQKNIDALLSANAFTITTGHQLNLFTGPLYFLYKIFSVINLSEELNKKYKNHHFVPVYWMASEDHDFDEINYFNFRGKKVKWDRPSGGAVGEFSTEGLDSVYETLSKEWGSSNTAQYLLDLFKESYLEHDTLSEATRFIGNKLFSDYGLVIIDGNDAVLKREFIPYAKLEFEHQQSFKRVENTTNRLIDKGYSKQVHPREINLFYLDRNSRERIVEKEGMYYLNDSARSFDHASLLEELEKYPERFSPNALLRPLYQEVILPNLCYVGGGGELAYWFQLKDYFKSVEVPFPILLLRNSILLISKKQEDKLTRLDVTISELFQEQTNLRSNYTRRISEIDIDFTRQREHLKKQFKALFDLAEKTDPSFFGAVAAQEKKQLNGLDHLEKRLLKAQKRNLADQLERLTLLQDDLFPGGNLQERVHNFSEWYLDQGPELLALLKEQLQPLRLEFTILEC